MIRPPPDQPEGAPPPTDAALDRLAVIAPRARPTPVVREIRFLKDEGVLFPGQDRAWLARDRANGVAVDPGGGHFMPSLDGRDLCIHRRIPEMVDPLHFGTFGAILSAMSATGMLIDSHRLAKQDGGGRKRRIVWAGMGRWACSPSRRRRGRSAGPAEARRAARTAGAA